MPRPRLLHVAAYEAALTLAAARAGVDRSELHFSAGKRPPSAHGRVRQTAIYLARIRFGVSVCDLARLAGVNHRAIGRSIARIEEARDDPAYDRDLDNLELELMA